MEWIKRAIELPEGWHQVVREKSVKAGGDKRGLTRYVWALAAYHVLTMDPEDIKAGAKIMREIQEESPELLKPELNSDSAIQPIRVLEKWIADASKPRRRRYVESAAADLDQAARRAKQKRSSRRSKRRSG